MTDTILKLLDPSALPPKAHANLAEIGPFLASGSFTLEEIGRQLDPPRSDWVASRVAEARTAIAEQVLENAGDELDDELRARLEAFARPGSPLAPLRFRRFRPGYPKQGRTGRGKGEGRPRRSRTEPVRAERGLEFL